MLLLALTSLAGCTRHHQVAPDVWVMDGPNRASTVHHGAWGAGPVSWWSFGGPYPGFGVFPPYRIGYGYGATRFPYRDLYYPWYGWTPSYVWGYPQHPWAYDRWWYLYRFAPTPVHPVRPPVSPGSVAFTPRQAAPPLPAAPPTDRRRAIEPAAPRLPEDGKFDYRTYSPPPAFERRIVIPRGPGDGPSMIVRSPGNAKPGPSRTEPVLRRPMPVRSVTPRTFTPAGTRAPRTLNPARAGAPRTFKPTRPAVRSKPPRPRITAPPPARTKAAPAAASPAVRSGARSRR